MAAATALPPDALRDRLRLRYRLEQRFAADPWAAQARPEQRPPPGEWRTWLVLAGRGFGKTRTGAEWVREQVMRHGKRRVALVAPTAADARDVLVEGESGLLAVCDRYGFRPLYEPTKRRLTFPNGAIATTYSADEPDRLRGPQHDCAYMDEVGAWRRPEAYDMLQFGLRLGDDPRQVVTTTPRPTPLLRRVLADPATAVTRGSTYDNRANLAPAFIETIIARYEGTRLGRQEIAGELLDDVEGALWTLARIDAARLRADATLPAFGRVVVAIDPQAGHDAEGQSETGIVAAARDAAPDKHARRAYVLADESGNHTPDGWARAAVAAFHRLKADRIVAEANQGGKMVEHTLRTIDRSVPITLVHASRGKVARAEPVAALYEQGRVHHVGAFGRLEDQMTTYVAGGPSPDRLDALCWAISDLMLGGYGKVWVA